MIYGIGTDLVELERIAKISGERFLERYFSAEERDMIMHSYNAQKQTKEEYLKQNPRISKIAGNFAVKEAVAKAFGTGFSNGVAAEEIAVLRDGNGKPYIRLLGDTKKRAEEIGNLKMHVSITNTKIYAQAFVVCELCER